MSFDLSKLPLPKDIATVSYEDNLIALLGAFKQLEPDWTAYLESDPVLNIFRACAYVLTNKDQQRNDQVKSILIAFAQGADLDNLGALLAESRQIGESDSRFRSKILTALFKASSAGVAQSYEALAYEADNRIIDVKAYDNNQPAKAFVVIQSNEDKDVQEAFKNSI